METNIPITLTERNTLRELAFPHVYGALLDVCPEHKRRTLYDLSDRGLVRLEGNIARITDAGREALKGGLRL